MVCPNCLPLASVPGSLLIHRGRGSGGGGGGGGGGERDQEPSTEATLNQHNLNITAMSVCGLVLLAPKYHEVNIAYEY